MLQDCFRQRKPGLGTWPTEKENYKNILKDNLKKSTASLAMDCCCDFQEENGTKHTSYSVYNVLRI